MVFAAENYGLVRHPQYAGFIAIMVGFLLQWPTLVMFPILVVVYRRLAIREERDIAAAFGTDWDAYAAGTPRLIPRLRHNPGGVSTDEPGGRVRKPQRPNKSRFQ